MTMRTPKTLPGNRQSSPEKIPHYRDEDLTQNFPFDLSFISGGGLPRDFPPSTRIYKHFPSSYSPQAPGAPLHRPPLLHIQKAILLNRGQLEVALN